MADFTEKQVYEALGLGEQAQEAAEPAQDNAPQTLGEQAQETAEPAQRGQLTDVSAEAEPTADADTPDEPGEEAAQGDREEKQPLTPEQRRANAAIRRQREDQARQAEIETAVREAVQQEQTKQAQALAELFTNAGLKNSITGEPITTLEQLQDWGQKLNEARLQRDLKAGKLTQEGLATAIGNHPIVKQAQALVEQESNSKRERENAAAKAKIDAEIAEIHKMDESIGTLNDLIRAPYWPELYAMTKRGYTIKDAHFLLNHERLEQAKIAAAKQASLNNARGKDHMTATGVPRGGGSVSVPAADLALFRQFNPNATDAEIQAYYNRYKNG